MTMTQILVLVLVLFCGYCGLFATMLTLLFYKERQALYRLLSGDSVKKSGERQTAPLKDRIKDLQRQWRAPKESKRKAGDLS